MRAEAGRSMRLWQWHSGLQGTPPKPGYTLGWTSCSLLSLFLDWYHLLHCVAIQSLLSHPHLYDRCLSGLWGPESLSISSGCPSSSGISSCPKTPLILSLTSAVLPYSLSGSPKLKAMLHPSSPFRAQGFHSWEGQGNTALNSVLGEELQTGSSPRFWWHWWTQRMWQSRRGCPCQG